MSFWGKIFGSDETTGKIIDTVSNGLDKLWHTDEEKADDRAQARREGQQFILGWLDTTKGQNLARRLIAMSLTLVWILMFIGSMGLSIAGVWSDNPENLQRSAAIIDGNIDQMTGAMMLILAFYFAAPHMGKIVEGALAKFGKSK